MFSSPNICFFSIKTVTSVHKIERLNLMWVSIQISYKWYCMNKIKMYFNIKDILKCKKRNILPSALDCALLQFQNKAWPVEDFPSLVKLLQSEI